MEVVLGYRYLCVRLNKDLTWSNNTSSLVRKAHKRPLLPREAEGCWTWKLSPLLILQMCVGERRWKLLFSREGSDAGGGEGCTEDCRGQLLHHHRHLHRERQEKGHLRPEEPHTASTHTLFVFFLFIYFGRHTQVYI